jgi:hypothetical protein
MNDTSVSAEVKKKVELYYKGDKRLSVVKFQDLLKKRIKGQKGGGWKIGAVAGENQYVVQAQGRIIDDIQPLIMYPTTPATPSPTVSPFSTPSPTPPPSENFTYNGVDYTTNNKLGEGAFAEVYEFNQTTNLVVKLFKSHSSSSTILSDTEACINEFISAFLHKIIHTSLPFPTKNANGSYAPYNIFVTQSTTGISSTTLQPPVEKRGYVMRKLDSIKSITKDTFEIALQTIKNCMENTQSIPFRFIHGDIKIENMLEHATVTPKNIVMTDMDGVYVYNISTLQHISRKPSYERPIYMTPACTHPILPWYTNKLREGFDFINGDYSFKNSGMTGMSSVNDKNYHMFNWKIMWAHMGSSTMVQTVKQAIMKVLDKKYEKSGGYASYVSMILAAENKKLPLEWLRDQLATIDMYSLGASAIFHYIKQLYALRSALIKGEGFSEGVPGLLRKLFVFAIDTIHSSLILIPTRGGSSKTIKKKKGGDGEGLATQQYVEQRLSALLSQRPSALLSQRPSALPSQQLNKYNEINNYIIDLVAQNEPNVGDDIDIANQTIIWNPPHDFPGTTSTTLNITTDELSWTP